MTKQEQIKFHDMQIQVHNCKNEIKELKEENKYLRDDCLNKVEKLENDINIVFNELATVNCEVVDLTNKKKESHSMLKWKKHLGCSHFINKERLGFEWLSNIFNFRNPYDFHSSYSVLNTPAHHHHIL